MKNEKWDDVHGNTTPDDRIVAFLESPTDSYAILQLREDVDDNIPLMFKRKKWSLRLTVTRWSIMAPFLCPGM